LAWEEAKSDNLVKNEGIVIIVFRSVDCVQETIDELEIVKSRLVGKATFDKLSIKDWEMQPGIPT
jgi:hypothetical protein